MQKKSEIRNPAVNINCRKFEVDNWLISEFILDKIIPVVGTRPYPLNELSLMVAAVCRLKPEYIFEWGTFIGSSARVFYETCAYFNIKTVIHSIDLPDNVEHKEHPKGERGRLVKDINQVILHQGDGLTTALEICKQNRINKRVLFFLDGDHGYKSVKRELMGIIKEIPQASILIHDTFYQSSKSGYNTGPFKAINAVLKLFPNKYNILSANTGLPGMTLLYKL
jgi:cephalosporin hydroxylase